MQLNRISARLSAVRALRSLVQLKRSSSSSLLARPVCPRRLTHASINLIRLAPELSFVGVEQLVLLSLNLQLS